MVFTGNFFLFFSLAILIFMLILFGRKKDEQYQNSKKIRYMAHTVFVIFLLFSLLSAVGGSYEVKMTGDVVSVDTFFEQKSSDGLFYVTVQHNTLQNWFEFGLLSVVMPLIYSDRDPQFSKIDQSNFWTNEEENIYSRNSYQEMLEDSVKQFTDMRPMYAHFRPKSALKGKKAAEYAQNYLDEYEDNLKEGIEEPVFSFALDTALDDEWVHIYCSKLIWLCYFKGADYEFENDYLWFSPEDLYTQLTDNPDFKLIYKHSEFDFKLNT